MSYWGIGMIILGGGAIMAAILNWDWWFRISSAGGHLVHDVFGRNFACLLNFVFGIAILFVGITDVSGYWPVSKFLNAWMFNDPSYLEGIIPTDATGNVQSISPTEENPSGLPDYIP